MEKDGYALIGETVEEIAREWEEFCCTVTDWERSRYYNL